MKNPPPVPTPEKAAPADVPVFDRAAAKQVFPVRHKASGRTINYTQPATKADSLHCFTGRGEFIATLATAEMPKE